MRSSILHDKLGVNYRRADSQATAMITKLVCINKVGLCLSFPYRQHNNNTQNDMQCLCSTQDLTRRGPQPGVWEWNPAANEFLRFSHEKKAHSIANFFIEKGHAVSSHFGQCKNISAADV